MINYVLYVRILGGDWHLFTDEKGNAKHGRLEDALGMKATILDPIREVMVVKVETTIIHPGEHDTTLIKKSYELVE